LRDGYPLTAVEAHGLAGPEQIEAIRRRAATAVPRRQREASTDVMPEVASADPNPEEQLLRRASQRQSRMLAKELAAAMKALPASDRRLLALRYSDGMQVSRIAAEEGLAPKPLYRRYEKIFQVLRNSRNRQATERLTAA
jgi:DNA-directed RNA polymerase specialized sigma24 family protein